MNRTRTPTEVLIDRHQSLQDFGCSTHYGTPEADLAKQARDIEWAIEAHLWTGPTDDPTLLAWRMEQLAVRIRDCVADGETTAQAVLAACDLLRLCEREKSKAA